MSAQWAKEELMAARVAVKNLHFSHIKPPKIWIYLSGDYVCPQIRVCGTGERAQKSALYEDIKTWV